VRGRTPRALAAAAIALAALMSGTVSTADAYPPCFGAASRDAAHPCRNPSLRFSVVPAPEDALLNPGPPCAPIDQLTCSFGVPADRATGVTALVGDSHAGHWRSSVEVVATELGWSVVMLARPGCSFARSTPILPRWKVAECRRWNQAATEWLADHPEISTIFMSNHPFKQVTRPRQSQQAAAVEGILTAWNQLPASVQHIIVIRDDPFSTESTLPCVERAMAKHRDAGRTCARARKLALHSDPYLVAARRLQSPRVQVVDLSSFFCSSRLCYPVVGGALVYKDSWDHLTQDFAHTLGPYLLDRVKRLMRTWS
jgi:SGNH domain-containing protein